jgi:Flp pilus assembly pilin Flp
MAQKGGQNRTNLFGRFCREDEAADATEYALIVSLISLAIVAAVQALGLNLQDGFSNLASRFPAFTSA